MVVRWSGLFRHCLYSRSTKSLLLVYVAVLLYTVLAIVAFKWLCFPLDWFKSIQKNTETNIRVSFALKFG